MTDIVEYFERKAARKWDSEKKSIELFTFMGTECKTVDEVALTNNVSNRAAAYGILQSKEAGEELRRLARKYLHPYQGTHTESVMISFALEGELKRQLAIPGGDDPGELHITLGYFGDVSELITYEKMDSMCTELAATLEPMKFELSGIARFSSDDGDDALVILVNHPDLPDIYERMRAMTKGFEVPYNPNFGYTAHVTLGWLDREDPMPLQRFSKVDARISAIELHYGTEIKTYLFGQSGEPQTKDVHTGNGGHRKRKRRVEIVQRAHSIMGGSK